MKLLLTEEDKSYLEKQIRAAEIETGAQIVLAVIRRCDNYAEIPWKAFALGASLTGLAVAALRIFFPIWISGQAILLSVTAILAAGAATALLSILLPSFARLFLTRYQREAETRQYAGSLFLSHELFDTHGRRGVLLMTGLFERHVVILPDTGLTMRLNQDVMNNIISGMKPLLRTGTLREAMETGLKGLAEALRPPVSETTNKNELPDQIIEEEGV